MESTGIQPGQTVTPTPAGSATPPAPQAPEPPAPEDQQVDNSQPEIAPEASQNPNPDAPDAQAITWTASEFIAHSKSFGWYAALALAAIAAAALVFFVTKDRISSGVILVAALVLAVYAGHKPRELQYQLDQSGLTIGPKHFTYDQFRCFSVLPEGAFSSIVFMPLKRFAVATTIYYAPEDEDKIVDLLGTHLPLEERGHDAVDKLMHRIHF